MPTYEYKCKKCKHEFEEVQSMSAEPLLLCPVCKTPNLIRLISKGGGMIFKGSGFYQTDYKNTKSDTKGSTSTSKNTKPSPAAKTEEKPSTSPKPDTSSKPEKPSE
ncbi:MAG: zinc ribbon domain-containing protein [Bacteroidota bacterium]